MFASIILHHIFKIAGPQQLWAEPPSEWVPEQLRTRKFPGLGETRDANAAILAGAAVSAMATVQWHATENML
ncbi:hypothetical protein P7K49_018902, partial [Saguinus oedipus]